MTYAVENGASKVKTGCHLFKAAARDAFRQRRRNRLTACLIFVFGVFIVNCVTPITDKLK
jgi:hypothetical protein